MTLYHVTTRASLFDKSTPRKKSAKCSCSLGFQIEVKCKKINKTTTPYLERTYFLSGIKDNFDFNLANLFQLENTFIDLTDMLNWLTIHYHKKFYIWNMLLLRTTKLKQRSLNGKIFFLRYYSKFNEIYKSKKTPESHIFLRKKCKNTFLTHNKSVNKGICTALSSLIMVMLLWRQDWSCLF